MNFRHGTVRAMAGIVPYVRFVRMMVPAVSARFGFKGSRRLADGTPQPTHHFGQDVIRLEAQAATARLRDNLYRDVPVSQVIGGTCKEQRRGGNRFNQ